MIALNSSSLTWWWRSVLLVCIVCLPALSALQIRYSGLHHIYHGMAYSTLGEFEMHIILTFSYFSR